MLHTEELQMYIENEMTQEQASRFEKKLGENKELRAKYRILKDMDYALNDEDALEIRAKFKAIHQKHSIKPKLRVVPMYRSNRVWAVAATIALVLGVAGLLWMNKGSNKILSGDQLYSMYFEKSEVYTNVRNVSSGDNNTSKAGFEFYEKAQYNEAISSLGLALNNNPNDFSVRLYLGLSYMETEKYQEAIEQFNFITSKRPNLFTESAEWFLALSHLKTNNIEEAVRQFDLISRNQYSIYRFKASEILKSINKE